MGLIDASVAIVIVLVFLYVIWRGMVSKNPKIAEGVSPFFPGKVYDKTKEGVSKEVKKQIWMRDSNMI